MPFEHRKLHVYARSIDLIVEVMRVVRFVKPGWSELIDQLKRACTSIVLNIAEGAAEYRPAEKARFYRMALRSAAEAHAAFDVLEKVKALSPENITHAQGLLEEIGAMLVAMCKQVESRPAIRKSRSRPRAVPSTPWRDSS